MAAVQYIPSLREQGRNILTVRALTEEGHLLHQPGLTPNGESPFFALTKPSTVGVSREERDSTSFPNKL